MIPPPTAIEMTLAAMAGVMRRVDSLYPKRQQTVPGIDQFGMGWVHDIEGALKEQAFARATGQYWDSSIRRFRSSMLGDVGFTQVRGGTRPGDHLIIRPNDDDNDLFVFLLGCDGDYRIVGSCYAGYAKAPQFLNRSGDSWWVPQDALSLWATA